MKKKIKTKNIKAKLLAFFNEYHQELWLKDKEKNIKPLKDNYAIQIITKLDIIYYLNLKMTLKEFNELLEQDNDLEERTTDFINNNLIHYASTNKLKELLQEYKDSNLKIEEHKITVDYSNLKTIATETIRTEKVSLAMGLESDLDEEQQNKILSTVEKFN